MPRNHRQQCRNRVKVETSCVFWYHLSHNK